MKTFLAHAPAAPRTEANPARTTPAVAANPRAMLNQVLDDCQRTLPDNLRLARRFWPNLPAAVALPAADLERVVSDAVRQAIDALGDGGEITVMAHPTEVRGGMGGGLAPGRYLLVTVQASGWMFAPELPLRVPPGVDLAWRAARDGAGAGVCLRVPVAREDGQTPSW